MTEAEKIIGISILTLVVMIIITVYIYKQSKKDDAKWSRKMTQDEEDDLGEQIRETREDAKRGKK